MGLLQLRPTGLVLSLFSRIRGGNIFCQCCLVLYLSFVSLSIGKIDLLNLPKRKKKFGLQYCYMLMPGSHFEELGVYKSFACSVPDHLNPF